MRSSAKGPFRVLTLASLVWLPLPNVAFAQTDSAVPSLRDVAKSSSSTPSMEPTCEARTVNYITDSLPQQCLTSSTGPIASVPVSTTVSAGPADPPAHTIDSAPDSYDPEGEDLSTGDFMSFEEWKAMMVAKSGPDVLDAKPRRQREGRGDSPPGEGFDSLGDEGEISFDFDAYSDKISEIASSARPREQEKVVKEQVEVVTYDEGFTYHRSKDAGTTCKERFSYSSFDAGATVKKTSPGAKNPTAILAENKDSYMLLECGMKNKFFIVELSDVILVDTVVIANFEFFSSMVRQFRVSISDRYPVKLDKWKVLGTFQARNSRDIQPFLIENPQDWARYLRVEILSHYGNEYYCPVSLLRVHGLRMLDSWKPVDPSELEGEDENHTSLPEPAEQTMEVFYEPPIEIEVVEPVGVENDPMPMEQSCWTPYWDESYFQNTFPLASECTRANSPDFNATVPGKGAHQTSRTEPHSSTAVDNGAYSAGPNTSSVATAARQTVESLADAQRHKVSTSSSTDRPISAVVGTVPSSGSRDATSIPTSSSLTSQSTGEDGSGQSTSKAKSSATTSIKPPSSRSSAKVPVGSQAPVRNKTGTATSPQPPAPTVQDSFFKALTKRLQILESNSTLSLQYIESQSRFLQEALAKLERRQVAKVDLFLDKLNNTVLGELREVRTLYDHIWQSTVIALESQREQTEHEIVALSARVGVLADEVVFQKRMAIVQSVLLLGCLVLVIFSRGFAGSAVETYYPSHLLASSSSRLASPNRPSTPRAQLRSARSNKSFFGDRGSANTTPARTRTMGHTPQPGVRIYEDRSPSRTPEARSTVGSKGAGSADGGLRLPATPNRTISDPSGLLDFQPPTPSSIDDMAYDSEPAMTPAGDYFSATTSINGDPAGAAGEGLLDDEVSRRYPERQPTPPSDTDMSDYLMPRPSRSGRAHSGTTRKPLPALPEDPD